MPKTDINDAALEKLLSHIGYGAGESDPNLVEVLIIGNESGTGGQSLDDFLNSTHVAKLETSNDSKDATKTSPFLQYIKRLSLYMQDGKEVWFKSKRNFESTEDFSLITQDWCGSNTHLIDIRPLPRTNESQWPYEAFNIDKVQYLDAFNTFNVNATAPYGEWVMRRKTHLNQQLASYPNLKYIIAPGAQFMKKTFLENCFPFDKPFTSMEYVNPRGKKKDFFVNHFTLNGKKVKVCTCSFFNHYLLGLDGLKFMASEILKKN
jgi:hypothetical protein